MKIIFNRTAISAAVAPLMCAVSGKSVLSATEGILMEAKIPDTCVMTTFDEHKGVRITVEAKVIEEGSFIINAQKFTQTLRVMEGEEVTLTVDDKLSASIVSGKSSHKMNALRGEDFPAIPDLVSNRSFLVGQAVFKKMLNKVSFAMGVNDTRTVLNGTYVRTTDDSLMMVACDSFKMAKCTRRVELVNKNTNGNEHLEYGFILPIKTVNELTRLLSDDEEAIMQLYVTRKHVVFLIGELTFFTRLLDGEYIDFNRIIMTNHKINLRVNRQELLSALERAALITEERIVGSVRAHVKLEIREELLKISAISSAGSTYDELLVEHEGEDLVIAFNNRWLIDSIRASESDKLILSLSSPLTSMNITPIDNNYEEKGEEEIFMLLPVRMKD